MNGDGFGSRGHVDIQSWFFNCFAAANTRTTNAGACFDTPEILSRTRNFSPRIDARAQRISRFTLVCFLHRRQLCRRVAAPSRRLSEIAMGRYVFAWLLGVPLGLLTLIYVLAHI